MFEGPSVASLHRSLAPPLPGRDERSSLLESRGEGLRLTDDSEMLLSAVLAPHPDRNSDPTSPRERG